MTNQTSSNRWDRARAFLLARRTLLWAIAFALTILVVIWLFTAPDFPAKMGFNGKTLWDFLDLVGIPLTVVVVGYIFSQRQKQVELEAASKERENDRQIARDREEETALQSYFDRMSDLLLSKDFRNPEASEARSVARSLTLTTLRRLGGERKGMLIQFLSEAGLITGQYLSVGDSAEMQVYCFPVIRLNGADLSSAELRKANLEGTLLSQSNLDNADLIDANLKGAILNEASLLNARLDYADLSNANFEYADMEQASLECVLARSARFVYANFRNANLEQVDFQNAEARGAYFVGANIENAIVSGMKIWSEQLDGADFGDAEGEPIIVGDKRVAAIDTIVANMGEAAHTKTADENIYFTSEEKVDI